MRSGARFRVYEALISERLTDSWYWRHWRSNTNTGVESKVKLLVALLVRWPDGQYNPTEEDTIVPYNKSYMAPTSEMSEAC